MLAAAIQSGVLDADSSTNAFRMIGNHSKTMVPRKALRAFAESKNQRPDFLFDTLRPQEGATKGSKGRPKGTGSFAAPDAILVNEMSSLLNNGKAKSVHDAASQLADKAVGNSVFESKVKRLMRRYKESLDNK